MGITALTLFLVVIRPRGLNEGVTALLGAALVLLLGLVPFDAAVQLELSNWNVFLFFLGMMAVAALADQSGAFDVVALGAARLARGRIVRLYVAVFLLGAVISVSFANDSAALVLTPIVYTLVARLSIGFRPWTTSSWESLSPRSCCWGRFWVCGLPPTDVRLLVRHRRGNGRVVLSEYCVKGIP